MDIDEKIHESGKSINNLLTVLLMSALLTSIYMIQRAILFINDESFFTTGQTQQQSQIQGGFGFLQYEFSYATMNVAWTWVLGALFVFSIALFEKRARINNFLSEKYGSDSTSLSLPLDFYSKEYLFATSLFSIALVSLSTVGSILQFFLTAYFFAVGEYIQGMAITMGCLFTLYTIFRFKSRLNRHNNSSNSGAVNSAGS